MNFTQLKPALLKAALASCTAWALMLCNGQSASLTTASVGSTHKGHLVLPVHQFLSPAGKQVDLPGLRPQVLRLSPDGAILVTSGKTHELIVIDPLSGSILQRVPLPGEDVLASAPVSSHILAPDKEGQASYTGLVSSPDGSRIYLSNVNGSIKVFSVSADHVVSPLEACRCLKAV